MKAKECDDIDKQEREANEGFEAVKFDSSSSWHSSAIITRVTALL